ncbi:hypothetical protein GTQ40_01165 [Flavobacteriaceae bacterium R38]|nr:hypothetical protein [Flavobacteriaceae bacterium R38]
MNNQPNNLDTFRILYIVKGILTSLFALFFIAYGLIGVFIGNIEGFIDDTGAEPFNPGIVFIIIGGIGLIITVIIAIFTFLTAKYIKERRHYNFIFVVAILNCLTGVLGILLGIFTIIEITKPHVKELFDRH